jgi:hypothetical protein
MSSLWTPSGERPVGPSGEEESPASRRPMGGVPGTARPAPPGDPGSPDPSQEEMAAALDEVTRQLAETPAVVVVANHAMGLFELGALHLSRKPPALPEAQVAIDAMGALVEGMTGRLGETEATVRDALAQLRLAFVQIRAAPESGAGEAEAPTS